ncbi:hypothetical protein L1887_52084 [Cichorium endivia]|nr:hypothetical protein L1887_52084 [Cichorium endivia]
MSYARGQGGEEGREGSGRAHVAVAPHTRTHIAVSVPGRRDSCRLGMPTGRVHPSLLAVGTDEIKSQKSNHKYPFVKDTKLATTYCKNKEFPEVIV